MLESRKLMLMISLTINDVQQSTVPAIVDMGTNCSCINTDFQHEYFPGIKLEKIKNPHRKSGFRKLSRSNRDD